MPQTQTTAPPRPAAAPACPAPLVHTRAGRRTLEFTPGEIQSEMLVARPAKLVLAYSRAMMCFALFVPRPRHILMVGLGGGSLAKFCHRHFPAARITVVELRADVIALREQFCVPPDDDRFRVVHADAVAYVAGLADSVDVLLIDGFDAAGLPRQLGSARFYADCRHALRANGVLVANVFSYDPDYARMLARLGQVFEGRLCWFDGIAGNNRLLFAHRGQPALQRLVARRAGLGAGWLNRLLARLVVAWLSRVN
jgi:spermidine synthase